MGQSHFSTGSEGAAGPGGPERATRVEGAEGKDATSLPEPSFSLLAASIAAQCQVALGVRPHPVTNESKKDLPSARHAIALLEMLESKTKGNLDEGERRLLGAILADLRMAYVHAAK